MVVFKAHVLIQIKLCNICVLFWRW